VDSVTASGSRSSATPFSGGRLSGPGSSIGSSVLGSS